MAILPISANADLTKGFTAAQVAEKHCWPEPMVWSMALDCKYDLQRFRDFAGAFVPGICGTGMIVTKDLVMNGPGASRPR